MIDERTMNEGRVIKITTILVPIKRIGGNLTDMCLKTHHIGMDETAPDTYRKAVAQVPTKEHTLIKNLAATAIA